MIKYKIKDSSFVISANGFADGPSQALVEFLIKKPAKRVTTITHPLTPESKGLHSIKIYENGKLVSQKEKDLPNKPPFTYLFDPFIPFRLPTATAWFAFNNLASLRGLGRRKIGRTKKVYYWAVDFVPQRFGPGLATKFYNYVDRHVSKNVDARIELSRAALDARAEYLGLNPRDIPSGIIVPMGAWIDRTPKVSDSSWQRKKIVYLGHLVERQGVATLITALSLLNNRGVKFSAEIIGSGPLEAELKTMAKQLKIKNVIFHGFVVDHKDVEKILGSGTIAVAPYVKDKDSFTQFADPGKLKAYLGAGLPMVLTDVPPNATELKQNGVAIVVNDSPEALADGIEELLNRQTWLAAHRAALSYARLFDWDTILTNSLKKLGFN